MSKEGQAAAGSVERCTREPAGGDGFWEKGKHSYACCNQLAASTRALAAEAGTYLHAALQRCIGHTSIKGW